MKKSIILIFTIALCLVILVACNAMAPDAFDGLSPDVSSPALDSSTALQENAPSYNFDDVIETGFVKTSECASSYFSLDRNTASYSLMRSIISTGSPVNKNSVRLEEYINYFDYDYPSPTGDDAMSISGSIFDTPYNENTKLFSIGLSAQDVVFEESKGNNIVFLIDTSGSMYGEDRLGLIQQSFTMLLDYLGENDTISIVTYASGVRVALRGEKASNKTHVAAVIQDLQAGGSTNGSGGIQLAYEVAQEHFIEGGNNRVILATAGDFTVGISNKNQLKDFVSEKRDSGVYLSVLGVGMYNTNDSIMNTLATNGNGNYAYLDSVKEAYKVLVKELNGTFNVVAKDAKIGVTFNSEVVEQYRLIGYETKVMNQEDFEDENKDAGEIGSGHTVTAVYELLLAKDAPTDSQYATVELKYKDPDTNESKTISKTFGADDYSTTPSEDSVFIGCVVEYGLILRQSAYRGGADLDNVLERLYTLECVNKDDFKQEFAILVAMANELNVYSSLEPSYPSFDAQAE